jgi:TolB-like protein/DNA-binding winged helix-turn-helix (wHTH) protein
VNDSHTIKIGEWTATPALNLLERGTEAVRIEPRAMDVLTILAKRAGEVVSVDELIAAAWKGAVVGDGSVYIAINQLRQALDGKNAATSHIETIPKRGYRLTVPVERDDRPAPMRQARDALRGNRRHARYVAGIVAAAVVTTAITWLVLRDRTQPVAVQPATIAVLPFENLSADSEQQHFADGVTAQIIETLTGIRDLRVTGHASSSYFSQRDADLGPIAATLGVKHVLTGSVRRAGDDIRIAAQLRDAETGYHLWSSSYERRMDDIFALQDEIAAAVAAALQITLGVGAVGRRPGMTRNVEAYDEYLRASAVQARLETASLPKAIEHLERAVALDPSFAVAWAALSGAYVNQATLVPERAADGRAKAAAALEHARTAAPDAPDVLVRTSMELIASGNWLDAGAAHARAVAAFADHGIGGEAAAARGYLLLSTGRAREAVDAFEHARAIDPLVPAYAYGLANARLAVGELHAALTEVDRGLGLDGFAPALRATGLNAALTSGDREEIVKRLESLAPNDSDAAVNRALAALLDEPSSAAAEIRRAAATADVFERTFLAEWAAYYGEPDLALELLVGAPPQYVLSTGLWWQPLLRDARGLPGFKKIARDLGLIDYWRAYGWPDVCQPSGDDFVCM